MARPAVMTFSLRLSDEEAAAVDAAAARLELSRSALVRRLFERAGVLTERPKKKPAAQVPDRGSLYRETVTQLPKKGA